MRRKKRAGSAKRNEKAFSASSAPWATRRVRVERDLGLDFKRETPPDLIYCGDDETAKGSL
jgi:hypothetical protein